MPIAYGIDFERAGSHAAIGVTLGLFVAPFEAAGHGLLFGWRAATFPFAIPGKDLQYSWFLFGYRPISGYHPQAENY